ncbi:hypothetical protein V8G54_025099 [Vigna mungo]|uniref:Uncharacterized protein n=1 Tax=Vigna mungo TaxID=3915 RepID=A0AAQ3RT76_VIGMU
MVKEVTESGSKPSSGKHSASTSSIDNISSKALAPKAPLSEPTSLEQLLSDMHFRFDGKPPLGNDSSLGQSAICNFVRDGRSVCMFVGNDSNLGHFVIVTFWR